jgi:uncharacterized protein
MNTYTLTEIHIYPVKSLGGISLEVAKVEARGLALDRQWLLINSENMFLTQREIPPMALIKVRLEEDSLVFFHQDYPNESFKMSIQEHGKEDIRVGIWNDDCWANIVSAEANEWFSDALGMDCRLVKMADHEQRLVDTHYASNQEVVSFADGYPYLIIGQSSLDDLNSRLPNAVAMKRFRPNFVFAGGIPYEEDSWKKFSIGKVDFFGVKPCGRCILTTVNPDKGEIDSKEPLRTLTTYRNKNNKILFGQNLLPSNFGEIRVGDTIQVQQRGDMLF